MDHTAYISAKMRDGVFKVHTRRCAVIKRGADVRELTLAEAWERITREGTEAFKHCSYCAKIENGMRWAGLGDSRPVVETTVDYAVGDRVEIVNGDVYAGMEGEVIAMDLNVPSVSVEFDSGARRTYAKGYMQHVRKVVEPVCPQCGNHMDSHALAEGHPACGDCYQTPLRKVRVTGAAHSALQMVLVQAVYVHVESGAFYRTSRHGDLIPVTGAYTSWVAEGVAALALQGLVKASDTVRLTDGPYPHETRRVVLTGPFQAVTD